MAEFDDRGRDEFLRTYGFGRATKFFVFHEGRPYDSKAIVGVAHRFRHGVALTSDSFSGGQQTVVRLLCGLGFEVGPPRDPDRTLPDMRLSSATGPEEMAATAGAPHHTAPRPEPGDALPDLDLDFDIGASEGRAMERHHLVRERDPTLRAHKIAAARRTTGRVACEACGFDFAQTYGPRGEDFIECHHRVPLHEIGPSWTTLSDLVLLCSNCHRIIHRKRPWLSFEELCALISANNPD